MLVDRFSNEEILEISQKPAAEIADWVNFVLCDQSPLKMGEKLKSFCEAVARLSDCDVKLDETENKLIDLARAGIITSHQMGTIQSGYLRGIFGKI